ncbi:FUSC family protein [Nonomuraea sp. NPDC052265]|uniref:FUSC family protein n=1 Tax=Nonomuraea sp. NPDC052265 TaxID=3364374 RepID=UPI0037CAEC70
MFRRFDRAWELLRPEGEPDVPAGLVAGVSIMLPLLAGTALGQTAYGAAMSLATTLMLYPAPFRLLPLMLVRTAAVTCAGVFAWLSTGHPWLLAAGVTAAAVAGALWPLLGTTGALAALLIAIMGTPATTGRALIALPGTVQLAGAVWGAAVVLVLGRLSATGLPPEPFPRRRRHAARLGVLVGASMSLMAVLGLHVAEGHWLVTSILNTLQPTTEATGTRYAKRLLGNVLGSGITALILLGHPSAVVTALCVGGAGVLAHTYRAANYTYWSIWMPMMLLLLSDFSRPEPWDASLIKMAMNVVGGLAAVLGARWLWPAPGAGRDGSAGA